MERTPTVFASRLTDRFTRAWTIYLSGIIVFITTAVINDFLNRRGAHGVSRFVDVFGAPLFSLSFLLCAAAPFFSSGTWPVRVGLFLAGILGFAVVLVGWAVISFIVIGRTVH